MKRMLLSLMVMAFTCSCLAQNTSNDKAISQSATYTLKGIFPTSLNGKKVTLYAHLDDPRTTESTVVRDGKFILTGPLESPSLARLVVSGGLFVENVTFVLEEGETTFTYVNNSLLVKGGKRTTIYLAHEETTKKLFNDQDRYLKYLASFLKKNNDNIIGAHFYSTFHKKAKVVLMLDERTVQGDFTLLDTNACQGCRFVCSDDPKEREQLKVHGDHTVYILNMDQVFAV